MIRPQTTVPARKRTDHRQQQCFNDIYQWNAASLTSRHKTWMRKKINPKDRWKVVPRWSSPQPCIQQYAKKTNHFSFLVPRERRAIKTSFFLRAHERSRNRAEKTVENKLVPIRAYVTVLTLQPQKKLSELTTPAAILVHTRKIVGSISRTRM